MNKKELQIVSVLVDAIEHMRAARAGQASAEKRAESKMKACELMASLPKNWFKHVDESWATELARYC